MSRITKMKYVAAETKFDFFLPTPGQTICKILKRLGNNLYRVCTPEGEEFLVSMPNKFRHHVYVKRGSFVVTEPIIEGKKVKAEIIRILQRPQIKYFSDHGAWPEVFNETSYLDNAHKLKDDRSDRGFVHGDTILLIDAPHYKGNYHSAANTSSSFAHTNEQDTSALLNQSSSHPRSDAATIGSSPCNSQLSLTNSDNETDSDSDDESDLVPNCNRKGVSRYVFLDEPSEGEDDGNLFSEDEDDSESDSSEDSSDEDSSDDSSDEDSSDDSSDEEANEDDYM